LVSGFTVFMAGLGANFEYDEAIFGGGVLMWLICPTPSMICLPHYLKFLTDYGLDGPGIESILRRARYDQKYI
jgi:hypothetical protein